MTAFMKEVDVAKELCKELIAADFGPFFGTPCHILAPLYSALQDQDTRVLAVPRDDNAIGIAAGTALVGRSPVVLMQNSGLGRSVNAIASLVVPYRIPMLLIVSLRGVNPDPNHESSAMGRLTEPLLDTLDMEAVELDPAEMVASQVDLLRVTVQRRLRPAALLVPPHAFGWPE